MSALKSEFKAVPDLHDLAALPREFRFQLVTNGNTMALLRNATWGQVF